MADPTQTRRRPGTPRLRLTACTTLIVLRPRACPATGPTSTWSRILVTAATQRLQGRTPFSLARTRSITCRACSRPPAAPMTRRTAHHAMFDLAMSDHAMFAATSLPPANHRLTRPSLLSLSLLVKIPENACLRQALHCVSGKQYVPCCTPGAAFRMHTLIGAPAQMQTTLTSQLQRGNVPLHLQEQRNYV